MLPKSQSTYYTLFTIIITIFFTFLWPNQLLLLYCINLVKLEKFRLSKDVEMPYISGRREYTTHTLAIFLHSSFLTSESIVFTTSFTVDFWKIINCMSMMDQLCYMPFGRVATSHFWSYGWLLLLVYSGCFGVANNCFLPSSMSRTSAMVGRLPGSNWVHSSPISKHLFISVSWDSLYKDRSNRSSICCLLSRTFQAWEEHYIVQC